MTVCVGDFDRFDGHRDVAGHAVADTAEDVQRIANDIFKTEALAVTVLGDLDGFKVEREQLQC